MQCEFDELLRCKACGYQARKPRTIRTCPAVPEDEDGKPIGVMKLASSYVMAAVEWVAAGRPTRSQVEIDAIVREQCQPCEKFVGSSCSVCGCQISRDQSALRNKAAMATEHCPLGKW